MQVDRYCAEPHESRSSHELQRITRLVYASAIRCIQSHGNLSNKVCIQGPARAHAGAHDA